MTDIDLIVVNYKTYALVQKFIDSYVRYKPKTPSKVTLIDNETDDQQLSTLRLHGNSAYGFEENLGYSKACNYGAKTTAAKYIAFLNSDTEFVNDTCVDRCVDYLEANPDVGVVGPLQYDKGSPRRFTHAGIFGPGDAPKHRGWHVPDRGQFRDVKEAITVSGSAMFVRREAWDAIHNDPIFRKHWPNAQGAMPEHFLYFEETAVCYAMPKFGYKVMYVGDQGAEMVHHWHKSIKMTGEGSHFRDSQKLFRALMDDWGILHD